MPSMSWCNECVLNDCVSEPNQERVTASGLMVKNESNVVSGPRSAVRGLERSPVLVCLYACRLFIVIVIKLYSCSYLYLYT